MQGTIKIRIIFEHIFTGLIVGELLKYVALMNLVQEILQDNSRAKCNHIVARAGKYQQRFNKLFKLFLSDENKD